MRDEPLSFEQWEKFKDKCEDFDVKQILKNIRRTKRPEFYFLILKDKVISFEKVQWDLSLQGELDEIP